jgi:hypothetical protein
MSRYSRVPYRPMPFQTATPYVAPTGRDAGKSQPGLLGLVAYWVEQAPAIARHLNLDPAKVNARSMGVYNFRNTASGSPSVHGEGRAADLGHNVTPEAHKVMCFFLSKVAPHARDLGIQYAIFASAQTRSGGWVDYGAVPPKSAHDDHAHVEMTWAAAAVPAGKMVATCRRRVGDWRGTQKSGGDEEMELTKMLQQAANAAGYRDSSGSPLREDGVPGSRTSEVLQEVMADARRGSRAATGLQTALNDAGFKDSTGRPVTVDGWVGARTIEALAAALKATNQG